MDLSTSVAALNTALVHTTTGIPGLLAAFMPIIVVGVIVSFFWRFKKRAVHA